MATWTSEDETRLQQLQSELRLAPASNVESKGPDSLLPFIGKELANLPSRMFSSTINTAQGLLGVDPQYRLTRDVTDIVDQAAPQGLAQQGISLAGGIAAEIPSFIGPQGLVARGAKAVGIGTRGANILGEAAGSAAPFFDQGIETTGVQAALGGSFAAVRDSNWKAKLAAGLVGGAAGYYEGSKISPEDAKFQGAFNFAIPTIVDPLLGRFARGKTKATQPPDSTPVPVEPFPFQPGVGNVPQGVMPPRDLWPATQPALPPLMGLREGVTENIAPLQTASGGGGQPIIGQPFPELVPNGNGRRLREPAPPPSGYRPRRGEEYIPQGALMQMGDEASGLMQLPDRSEGGLIRMGEDVANLQLPESPFLSSSEPRPTMDFPAFGNIRPQAPEGGLMLSPAPEGALMRQPPAGPEFRFPARTGGLQMGELLPSAQTPHVLHLGELQPRPEPIITGEPQATPFADITPVERNIRPPAQSWASEVGAKYDGFDAMTGKHQLTLLDEGKESTFYVDESELNPQGIKAAVESKRAEMQGPAIGPENMDAYLDALAAGKGDEFIANLQKPKVTPAAPARSEVKLASGLIKELEKVPDWPAAGQDFAAPYSEKAIAFGATQKTKAQKARLLKGAEAYRKAHSKAMKTASTDAEIQTAMALSNKAQFLQEAHDYSAASVKKKLPVEKVTEANPPKQQVELATVQVLNNRYRTWENARVLARSDDGVLHVEIDDPIFGTRQAFVNEKSTRAPDQVLMSPVEPVTVETANEAALTQRGKPESVMERITLALQKAGAPAFLVDSLEHIGDLSHRAQKQNALINVDEKLRKIEATIGNPSRYTIEQELVDGYRGNAEYRVIQSTPELKALYDNIGKEGGPERAYDVYKKTRTEYAAAVEEQISKAKKAVTDMLPEYVQAHVEHNRPVTQLGQWGKEAAIALGSQDFDKLRSTVKKMRQWLKEYNALSENAKLQKFLTPADQTLSSVIETGPGPSLKTIKGNRKLGMELEQGLKKLPTEAADLLRSVFKLWTEATGQQMDYHFSLSMLGAKAGAYTMSGKVGFSLNWVNSLVRNWAKMGQDSRAKAVAKVAGTLGHEITHVAQMYGENSGLAINGVPLLKAITDKVFALTLDQRKYIIDHLAKAKGDNLHTISAYLAGDVDVVKKYYEAKRGKLTNQQAMELAAGEFMAEVGSQELAKRVNLIGLPAPLRAIVDTFKGVIVRMVAWLKGEGANFAALQDLSAAANKMFDHFAAADKAKLHKAFPASDIWDPNAINKYGPRLPFSGPLPQTVPPTAPVTPHTSAFLKGELQRLGARAVAGGVIGGFVGPKVSDNQISTAEGIILGGVLGVFGPAVAKRLMQTDVVAEATRIAKQTKGNPLKAFRALMDGRTREQMGIEAARGGPDVSASAKFVRAFEKEFNLGLDPLTAGIFQHGQGLPQEQLLILHDAFKKTRWFDINQPLKDATEAYYTGKLSKSEFINLLQTDAEKQYGNFAVTLREAQSTISRMFAEGLPDSAFKTHVIKVADEYVGKFYKAYKTGEFDEAHFQAAKADLMKKYPAYSDEVAENIMRDHQKEIQANRSMFSMKPRGSGSGQAVDARLLIRRLATEEEVYTQRIIVGGLEHDPTSIAYKTEKAKLDWMLKHTITDGWARWLGEIKDPNERMMMTFAKVYPSSISSKIVSLLDSVEFEILPDGKFKNVKATTPDSMKYAYTPEELSATIHGLEALGSAATPVQLAKLQKLRSYMPLDHNPAYGKLSGKMVDRYVRDEMATYDSGFKWMDQPILRGISNFNNMVKISRTALNPLTTIRNYFQLPVFALMSQAKFSDLARGWNILKHNIDPETLSILRQKHIVGADFVSSELAKGPASFFTGQFDADVAVKGFKAGLDKMLEIYQVPDQLHRVATFLSARDRFATKLVAKTGMSMDDALRDISVIDKAANWTERYTMNYSSVSRIVKAARQLPFVSLFISYTAEITKILANLAEDIIKPNEDNASRLFAMTVLGSMVAVPAILTEAAKGSLSPKDKADWEKLEKLSPDYLRTRFRLPYKRDKEGRFHYVDMTNFLPADNYSQMVKAALNGDTEGAMAANPIASLQDTPLLNIAAEQITGTNIRTGQPLEGLMQRASAVLKEVIPPVIPPGYEGQRLQRAFTTNEEGELGITNLRTGVETKPSDIIWNYMFAMRFNNAKLETVQKQAVSDAQRKIAMEQLIARRVLNSNTNTAEKVQAAEHLRQMQMEIMKELTSKLQ